MFPDPSAQRRSSPIRHDSEGFPREETQMEEKPLASGYKHQFIFQKVPNWYRMIQNRVFRASGFQVEFARHFAFDLSASPSVFLLPVFLEPPRAPQCAPVRPCLCSPAASWIAVVHWFGGPFLVAFFRWSFFIPDFPRRPQKKRASSTFSIGRRIRQIIHSGRFGFVWAVCPPVELGVSASAPGMADDAAPTRRRDFFPLGSPPRLIEGFRAENFFLE